MKPYLTIIAALLATFVLTGCPENPIKYVNASDPDSVASYLVGMCGIADDGAIATAEAFEAAGMVSQALTLADLHDHAVPICKKIHDAQVKYRVALATGADPAASLTNLKSAIAENDSMGNPIKALDTKLGGK